MKMCELLTVRRQIIYRDFRVSRIRLSASQHKMKAAIFSINQCTEKDVISFD